MPVGAFAGRQIDPLTDLQALYQSGAAFLGVDRSVGAVQQGHPTRAAQPLPHVGPHQRRAAPVVGTHVRDFDSLGRQRPGVQRLIDVDDHNTLAHGLGANPHQLTGIHRCDDNGTIAPGDEIFDDADLVGDVGGPDQAENFEVGAGFQGVLPDPGLHSVAVGVGERFQYQRHFTGIGGAGRRCGGGQQQHPNAKARKVSAYHGRKGCGHSAAMLGRSRQQEGRGGAVVLRVKLPAVLERTSRSPGERRMYPYRLFLWHSLC